MFVCMYVCTYVCMYVCVRMHVCMHACMHACMIRPMKTKPRQLKVGLVDQLDGLAGHPLQETFTEVDARPRISNSGTLEVSGLPQTM